MGQNEPNKSDPPPSNQPPGVSPPTVSQTASLLSPGQASVQTGVAGARGQGTSVTGAITAGLPAFSEQNSATIQLGVGNTGVSGQLQGSRYWGRDETSQSSVLVSANLGMNPKLAAGLGVNLEHDWGGTDPQRPKYQVIGQIYGSDDRNATIGSASGVGYTGGVSGLGLVNSGITRDLNPKYTIGVEVKAQGTHISEGSVDQFLSTGGVVAARNWTLDHGSTVVSVGATAYGGVDVHQGSVHGVYGGGLTVGVAFGGPPAAPAHEPEKKEEPAKVVEVTAKGLVQTVDREHDRLVMDIGAGRTQEFKLSRLRNDAADAKEFDAAMQHGRRIDITTTSSGRSHISHDYGRDDEWRKADLLKRAEIQPNGDLKIGNLTAHGDVGSDYKHFLAKPYDKTDNAVIDDLEKDASAKQPTELGRPQDAADFYRGSQKMPKLAVHMASDGKGGERGALAMKGCTFTGIDEKDGIATVHYKIAGRDQAISMPSTVGGYGRDPANPYNTPSIEGALKGEPVKQEAREVALAGAKDLVRNLDAGHGPIPLQSPNGTTGRDLLKRATFDENTLDVHIGNLTLKKDVAAYYMRALSNEKDPEFVARVERLSNAKEPTEIDLAKTRDSAVKAREALGFGEPQNPIKVAFSSLKENEKFDFSIDQKNDAAKLVNRTENLATPIHASGVEAQQPVPPQQERSRQLVHGGPG
jgi:hypothetical protein